MNFTFLIGLLTNRNIHALEYLKQVSSNLMAPAGLHTPHIWYTVNSYTCICYKRKWRNGDTGPLILNLRIGWRFVASFMLWLLCHWRKCPHCPLGKRLVRPHSQSWLNEEWSNHNAQLSSTITMPSRLALALGRHCHTCHLVLNDSGHNAGLPKNNAPSSWFSPSKPSGYFMYQNVQH
jgi:hypothetical protein